MKTLHFVLALWFFSAVRASLVLTNTEFSSITPGQPFTITWTGQSSAVTLTLVSGPATSLTNVLTIATSLSGTSYTWTPPTSLPSGKYALEISDGSSINYSVQFTISGAAAVQGSSVVSQSAQASSVVSQSAQASSVVSQSAQASSAVSQSAQASSTVTQSNTPLSSTTSTPLVATSPESTTTPTTTPFPATTPSLTTTSSASSPTSSVQSTSYSGLGAGASAGVGVGAVLVTAICIFMMWLFFRRKREEKVRRDAERGGTDSPAKGPELMTPANTHEMEGKPAADPQVAEVEGRISTKGEELDSEHVSPVAPGGVSIDARELEAHGSRILPELGSEEKATVRKDLPLEMQTQSNVHEMATATNVGSDWERLHPSELDSKVIDKVNKPAPDPSVPTVTSKTPLAASTNSRPNEPTVEPSTITPLVSPVGSGPDELEALQKRMEQVRADKERLLRIQQLEDLEAELQRDIMAEQKRRQDAASGS